MIGSSRERSVGRGWSWRVGARLGEGGGGEGGLAGGKWQRAAMGSFHSLFLSLSQGGEGEKEKKKRKKTNTHDCYPFPSTKPLKNSLNNPTSLTFFSALARLSPSFLDQHPLPDLLPHEQRIAERFG